jgi:exodeoxyribonuclease-5
MGWGQQKSLLDDLLEYVFSGINCKLILIGDTAQLPPIGLEISPALDEDELYKLYGLNLEFNELTEVVRQQQDSGILELATFLRNKIMLKDFKLPLFNAIEKVDLKITSGYDLEDALDNAYSKYGDESVMVICRSNKRANLFNLQIRSRIKWLDDELATGDYLMIVKNNYYWLDDTSKAGFIANGDIVEVMKVKGEEEKYGFRFFNITIRLVDYPDEPNIEVKILPESMMAESPSISPERFYKLYEAISEEYSYEPNKKKRNELIRNNPYYQALQVKFSYAVTCHKSQGGQWDAVFVEQGYLTEEMLNVEYLRWLYTAITRAKKELHLVNFNPQFFEGFKED